MSAVQWFRGPPPAVGWWPARYDYKRFDRKYRFWNGVSWSNFAMPSDSVRMVLLVSEQVAHESSRILWRHWSIEIDGTDGRGAHL